MRNCLSIIICLCSMSNGFGQHVKLTIEPNHSTIGFAVPIGGGITRVTGKFTESDLLFDYIDKDLTKSKVVLIIKAASVQTGIADRDTHLKEPDFFDAAQYPDIVFTSSKISGEGTSYLVTGTLTMRGVTRVITVPLKNTGTLPTTFGFQVRCPVNRKDFGIGSNFKHTAMSNFLPDSIDVEIDLWTKLDRR